MNYVTVYWKWMEHEIEYGLESFTIISSFVFHSLIISSSHVKFIMIIWNSNKLSPFTKSRWNFRKEASAATMRRFSCPSTRSSIIHSMVSQPWLYWKLKNFIVKWFFFHLVKKDIYFSVFRLWYIYYMIIINEKKGIFSLLKCTCWCLILMS